MKSVSLKLLIMRTAFLFVVMVQIMCSCADGSEKDSSSQTDISEVDTGHYQFNDFIRDSGIDYYQFNSLSLDSVGIDASIMIPNETAGIGASFETEIAHEDGGFKWLISVGRNFNIFIEDYGDYQYLMPEFIRRLNVKDIFKTKIVTQTGSYVIYKRELNTGTKHNSTYHFYGVKYINGVYYEIKNSEEGNSKKVVDFILKSYLSFYSNLKFS